MNAIWSMAFRSLARNGTRSLLQAGLICFAAFVMAYFAQFVAGITKNFTENLVELATGDMYISSQIDNSTEQSIFDREYEYLRMSESFLADLSNMQEVTEVNHRIEIPVRFNLPDDTVTFKLSAFNIETEQRLKNNFTIVEGRMIENNAFEIILPADFARRNNIALGDTVPLLAGTVKRKVNLMTFKVVGTFTTQSLSAWFNNSAYTSLAPARTLLNSPLVVTRLNIHLTKEANTEQFKSTIEQKLNAELSEKNPPMDVTPWTIGAAFFSSLIYGIETGFVIVIFIIFTILGCNICVATIMNVMERSKEIATLGALGAAPKVIRRIFIRENTVLSDISALVGISLAFIAFLITQQSGIPVNSPEFESFLGTSHFYPAFDPAGFIVPFILCKFVTFFVSFIIIRRAAKKPIAETMAKG